VRGKAPPWRSLRFMVTEHGIPSQLRISRGRRHRSRRRRDDLPSRLGKPGVGRRVTGEPLEPAAATRNAQRPKGEKRKPASRLPGNSYGRFARCADGKGPRERYLASRLSYLAHPFVKETPWAFITLRFLSVRWYSVIDRGWECFSFTRENTRVWAADHQGRPAKAA